MERRSFKKFENEIMKYGNFKDDLKEKYKRLNKEQYNQIIKNFCGDSTDIIYRNGVIVIDVISFDDYLEIDINTYTHNGYRLSRAMSWDNYKNEVLYYM